MIKIYSFDIFDTCITRTFFRPTDLFYQLFKNLNPNFTPEDIYDLVRLRIKAESEARSLSQKEDITLQDIYDRLDIAYYDLEPQTVKQTELDLEFQSLRPIREIQIKIESLRHQGHRIIFISDMYLPTEHIQKILIHNQIAQSSDPIYVSGDIGLTKATGNLFKYVLKSENIFPKQLHHTGDNIYSDILIPQKLGIKTTRFTSIQPTRYEEKAFNETIAPIEIRSQIAGISRAVRLQEIDPGKNNREIVTIAANVIAPLLTSYVTWVLEDAKERGIERLYFVSRDGQILLKIAQQLSYHYPSIELRYLYGSRQAWFLPSITEVNRKYLDWLVLDGHSKKLTHLLKKLNIYISEIEPYLEITNKNFNKNTQIIDQSNLNTFWDFIESKNISELILEKATISRKDCINYFEQNGLFDQKRWAIVDIGWTLKCQRSLRTLLRVKDPRQEAIGYYFALFRDCLSSIDVGQYRAFLTQDLISNRFKYRLEEVIFKHQNIIEQAFTIADHPSVVGYQKNSNGIMSPLYEKVAFSQNQDIFTQIAHATITRYATEISKANLKYNLDIYKQTSLFNTIQFLVNPKFQEAQSISTLFTFDDQNHSQKRPVTRPLNLNDLIYFLLRLMNLTQKRDYEQGSDWLEGSIMVSHFSVKFIYWIFKFIVEKFYISHIFYIKKLLSKELKQGS